MNWALARQLGWRVILRIDDLDGPRVRHGEDAAAIDDLRWLGLDWDEGPFWQSHGLDNYSRSLDALHRVQAIYPCHCSRREIVSEASAPHRDEHELHYPGTCRPAGNRWHDRPPPALANRGKRAAGPSCSWRLVVADGDVHFEDLIQGEVTRNVAWQVGDFVVVTKRAQPSYQLAVVVDDARQGVTDVVRGDDLIDSTARQRLIYEHLAPKRIPRYWHVPLIVGPDGRRLAKRHGDSRIAMYRDRGTSAGRIIALLARWTGIPDVPDEMDAADFCQRFDLKNLPSGPVVFTEEDHVWLMDC